MAASSHPPSSRQQSPPEICKGWKTSRTGRPARSEQSCPAEEEENASIIVPPSSSCGVYRLLCKHFLVIWPSGSMCLSESPAGQYFGDQIQLIPGSGFDASLIDGAISMWDSGCSGQMGIDFPALQNGGSGGAAYTVTMGGINTENAHCGEHTGNTVILYTASTDAAGTRQSCGNTTMNLAHEIGHILGLDDAPQGTQCQHHIMAWINHNNAYSRSVSSEECIKVDSKWKTSHEPTGGGGGHDTPPCV